MVYGSDYRVNENIVKEAIFEWYAMYGFIIAIEDVVV